MSPPDSSFREMIDDPRPHIFDGGMGTELYGRGVFINRSFDEANLSRPLLPTDNRRQSRQRCSSAAPAGGRRQDGQRSHRR